MCNYVVSAASIKEFTRTAILAVAAVACGGSGGDGYHLQQDPPVDSGPDGAAGDARVPGDAGAEPDAPVTNGVDLSLEISASPDPVAASSTLTYQLDVVNHSGLVARNVKVTQLLPAGNISFQSAGGPGWQCGASGQIVTCTRDTLIEGAAPSIAVAITTPSTGGSLSSSASVQNDIGDPDTGNNEAAVATSVVASSDLAITLTGASSAAARSTLSYTIDVNNSGPRDATNLTVTNRLPDGNVEFLSAAGIGWACALSGQLVTCTRPLLIVGAAPSITVQITTPGVSGPLVDQASVSSATADLVTDNNTASVMTSVFDSADLSIAASDSPDPVRIGEPLTYTLAVANGGPTGATALEVTDQLPEGTTFVSASGAGWSCSFSTVVTCTLPQLNPQSSAPSITIAVQAPVTARTMTNLASVASATSDPDRSNNSVSTSTLVNLFADLDIQISDSQDPVQGTTAAGCAANDCVTYPIDVTNIGPDPATSLRVVIGLPLNGTFYNIVGSGWVCPAPANGAITCTRQSLAVGAAPTIFLTWKAPSPGGFSIVTSVTVTGSSTDPDTSNNAASDDTTVLP
jgi:uncharacterized repeat protein (TIGR01451 family)